MRKKVDTSNKIKPAPGLFNQTNVGRAGFKPLIHKDGTPFKDVDYFELLGRKCIEMDKSNPNPNIPTNYGKNYDLSTINVAKQVVKALDEGMSRDDVGRFINQCIDFN